MTQPILPRAMLIDLDETILSFGSREALLEAVAAEFAAAIHPLSPAELGAALEAHSRAFWADEARHKAWRFRIAEARRTLTAELFDRLRHKAPGLTAELAVDFADRFHTAREGGVRCFPGALEAIDALKARGVALGLITNGTSLAQRAKVKRFALEHRFDHIQIEEEAGFGKPEERAYAHALGALGVAAQECWMVGDNLEWEVAAPQRLGIYSIWHDGYGRGLPAGSKARPDRIIRRLSELLD